MANIPMKDIQFPGLDDTYTFAQVDATLTTQGKAADAKKTGDEISELKADLSELKNITLYEENLISNTDITIGENINTTTGVKSSGYPKRARTDAVANSALAISFMSSVYVVQVLSYGVNGRVIDGTGYNGKLTNTWTNSLLLAFPDTAKKVALIFKRLDDADFTSSDVTNLVNCVEFLSFTDKTLTRSGVPADSQVVGYELSNMLSATRNLFDVSILNSGNVTVSNGVVIGLASSFVDAFSSGIPTGISYGTDQRYTLSFKAYTTGSTTTGNGLRFVIKYTDGTQNVKNIPNNTSTYTDFTYTTAEGKTIDYIAFGVGSGTGNTWYLKDIQIEEGISATSYIPYESACDFVARDTVDKLIEYPTGDIYTSDDSVSLVSTYSGVIALYDALVSEYPEYISKNTLTSGNIVNYEYVLTVGNYNSETTQRTKDSEIAKPVILICSGVHGYEQSSVMSLYGFVKALCEKMCTLDDVIGYTTIKVIPIVCPYGYDHDSRLNENGVNINRNFASSDWEQTSIGDNYSGASAGDQDETQIVQDWIDANTNAVFLIDWHNSQYTAEVSCLLGENTADSLNFKKKALLAINKIVPYWQYKRKMESSSNVYIYTATSSATGTTRSYGADKGIISFTLETSWNINGTGKNSNQTIGVGTEMVSSLLNGLKSYYESI